MNSKNTKSLVKICFITYCIILMCQILAQGYICYNNALYSEQYYTFWHFSEWLINYEGGFVRRGLCGEILLFLYNTLGINISVVLYIISYTSTITLIMLTFIIFKRKGLSFILLPTVIALGGFAMNIVPAYRRDTVILLFIFAIFYLYRQYHNSNKFTYYILFCICSIAVILMHEASFFLFVPAIFIHRLINGKGRTFLINSANSTALIFPIIITMGSVCLFSGDRETANAIWESYTPFFNEIFGKIPEMGLGVEALTWDSLETFKFHFATNYTEPLVGAVPRWVAWIAIFLLTFYLCANVNMLKIFSYEKEGVNFTRLTEILIFQFISLSLMFTILSCDLRRVVIYWTLSSFFIYTMLGEGWQTDIPIINNAAIRINRLFNKNRILSNKVFYIVIAITLICPYSGFPLETAYKSSIVGNIFELLKRGADIVLPYLDF